MERNDSLEERDKFKTDFKNESTLRNLGARAKSSFKMPDLWQKTTKTAYGGIVIGNGVPSRSGVMSGSKEKPLYLALGLAAVPAGLYSIARAVGLADLGRRVDLVRALHLAR